MKQLLLPFTILCGVFAGLLEFQIIRPWSISFIEDILAYIPLCLLIIFSIFLFKRNSLAFSTTNKVSSFLPFVFSALITITILVHMFIRLSNDSEKSIMKAFGYNIDNGELTLDFKENGIVTGDLIQKFTEKHYSGKYKQIGDTLIIDMITDLEISNKFILKGDTLQFLNNDTAFFYLNRQ